MNHRTSANIQADPNGTLTIANDETTITIQPDGTISISTEAPLQLVGRTLAKLDKARLGNDGPFAAALLMRLERKR